MISYVNRTQIFTHWGKNSSQCLNAYDVCVNIILAFLTTLWQVNSHQSAQPLGIDDLYMLGEIGMDTEDYGLAAQWFNMAAKGMQQQQQQEQQQQQQQKFIFSLSDAYHYLALAHEKVGLWLQTLCSVISCDIIENIDIS